MKNLLICSFLFLFMVIASADAGAQTLKADYQFQGNLNSSVAGAPAATNLTGSGGANSFAADTIDGYSRQTLRFPFNSGLSVNISGLIPSNSFTFVALFRFDNVSGFRRIAGSDPADDGGAYISDGRLEYENPANAPFRQDHYIQLVVVREANGNVTAYRDGSLRVTAPDAAGDFIISTGILRLFQDDTNLPTEASAGNIARLRFYDGPMTGAQVRALDRVANSTGGGDQAILFHTVRDGNGEIYSMNADGTNHRRLTNNEFNEGYARWSPDRQKIVYRRRENSTSPFQIWVMNSDGSAQTRLTNTAAIDQNPSFRPDGQKIIFSRCDASYICDIYTMNPDGGSQAPLPAPLNSASDEDQASYSADGTKITFVGSTSGASFLDPNIYVANADGSNRVQLTNTVNPISNSEPRFSPNGSKIVFTRWATSSVFTADIFAMNAADGSGLTRLTNDGFADFGPVWSPDGATIAMSSEREGVFVEVYTLNAATGATTGRLTTNSVGDVITDWYRPAVSARRTPFDFDGDGRSDESVFRPSSGVWYLNRSQAGFTGYQFGSTGDVITPADFTGDGKTDLAVFRPSAGAWFILKSEDSTFYSANFGSNGDVPVPGDFDADGKADTAVFRPSTGYWFIQRSTAGFNAVQFGANGDVPTLGDFDGDAKTDVAVFRPSTGVWYRLNSGNGSFFGAQFGQNGDMVVPADYSGDGKTDLAVWRPASGTWYIQRSEDNSFYGQQFGSTGDIPAPGDFDGDGKADVTVFRPSNGVWFELRSTSGFAAVQFGSNGDKPAANAFVY